MQASNGKGGEAGYTLIEMMIAITVMVIITFSVLALLRDGLRLSNTTYELTDAQESLRTGQEMINRDLTNAGDGMKGIGNICVRSGFVTNYLSRAPVAGTCPAGTSTLAIITSDNNVPAGVTVQQVTPTVTVRSTPQLTDRLTILQADRTFVPITLPAGSFTADGLTLTLPAGTNMNRFTVGEIYFINSEAGATFATITAKDNTNRRLTFANSDAYGLNLAANNGPIDITSSNGTIATSLLRMRIIHYFINSNGLLVRRILGVRGSGHNDSVIAERATDLQFRYLTNIPDVNGFVQQPLTQLDSSDKQIGVRQVEVSITTETVRPVIRNQRQQITMTTSTGVRNMQFLRALQPTAENYEN